MADAFIETSGYEVLLPSRTDIRYPIFRLEYEALIFRTTVIYPNYCDIPSLNIEAARSTLRQFPNTIQIYTDGSKTMNGTGSAFYAPACGYSRNVRIPDGCSVYTAEAIAIRNSLQWVDEECQQDCVILSDSLSVLQSIDARRSKTFYDDDLICDIKAMIHRLYECSRNVIFIWVKSHTGIDGNETVDQLAKEATQLPNITTEYISTKDLKCFYRKKVKNSWEEMWKEYVQKSNNHYALIHPVLPKTQPHIFDFAVSKFYSGSITRLKLNHGGFPSHLFRIGVLDSPSCTCNDGQIADVNHLFFNCNNYFQQTRNLIESLKQTGFTPPLNITSLLSTRNRKVYDIIIKYICETRINI